MSYSDIQMIIASQIAYMDFDKDAVDAGIYTIKELLEMEIQSGDSKRKEDAEKLLKRIQESPSSQECGNWIIKDIRNQQHTSGMYACMIDTGEGNALIAFRGSESDTLENKVKDWVLSDFGLLNSVLTPQQITAEEYIRDIYKQYGDQYHSFSMTGHSLGGNLAEHAAITAPDGMRGKITQCVNLDGPGFSETYLIAHASDIRKSEGIIKHYQWSLVGALLNPVLGSDYRTIRAETPEKKGVLSSMAWRHDTYNVTDFDENGNALPGKKDWLAEALDPLAKSIDFSLFTLLGTPVVAMLYNSLDIIKDCFDVVWERWNEIRYSGRNAQFEINLQILNSEIDRLESVSVSVKNISREVERIEKQLAFDSLSSGYVKMKLWTIASRIGNDGDKVGRYCEKGRECGRAYQISEQKIVDCYI